jgi:hypothetical protein
VADSPPKTTILPSEAELAVNDVGQSKIAVETKLRPKATQEKPEVKQAAAEVVPEARVKDIQPKIEPNQERSLGKPVPRAIGSVVNLIV